MFRDLSAADIEHHEAELAKLGYTIIAGLLDEVSCDHVKAGLDRLHATRAFGENDFSGTRTKRVYNLFAKTRVLDPLLVERSVLAIARSALGPEAQLSIASTMEIHAGETPQALHQDDAYFPELPHPPLVINTIWALTDFSEANGGTRIVPGSRRRSGPVDPDAASIAVEMSRGSVRLWNGACWHGGGANETSKPRFGLSLNYCRGWLRQQENQYLSVDPAVVAGLPDDVQKLLGYDNCQFLGWADGRHPKRAILPDVRAKIHRGMGREPRQILDASN